MMKQSRLGSFGESVIGTAAGFFISLAAQYFILPLLGVAIAWHQNIAFAVIMTVISIARTYVLRRVFEFFRISRKFSAAMQAVIAERFRQVEVEGWSVEHDDEHQTGELARAGAAYAINAPAHVGLCRLSPFEITLKVWPWSNEWWKPGGFRRDLIKAAALILAEIERHDRGRKRLAQVSVSDASGGRA
jgi:hypothetical protein